MNVTKQLEILEPPTREGLADQVVTILKRFVLVDDLKPGSRLPTERRLADTLNVSRTVLREALSRLIGEGLLVRTSPRVLQIADFDRETLVASLSPFDDRHIHFRDLMELRYILEMGALPVIINKMTPEFLADIEYWAEAYEGRLRSGDAGHGMDIQFHASLLRTLNNPTIESLLPLIEEQIREYLLFDPRQLGGGMSASNERVMSEHREILEAIRARRPMDALAAMERHLSPYFMAMQRRDDEPVSEMSLET